MFSVMYVFNRLLCTIPIRLSAREKMSRYPGWVVEMKVSNINLIKVSGVCTTQSLYHSKFINSPHIVGSRGPAGYKTARRGTVFASAGGRRRQGRHRSTAPRLEAQRLRDESVLVRVLLDTESSRGNVGISITVKWRQGQQHDTNRFSVDLPAPWPAFLSIRMMSGCGLSGLRCCSVAACLNECKGTTRSSSAT